MTPDRRATPVTIRGKTYPSHQAAADELGVTVTAISQAKARGYLDNVGLRDGNRVPTTIDGVTSPSRAEASRQTGIPLSTVHAVYGPQRREAAE